MRRLALILLTAAVAFPAAAIAANPPTLPDVEDEVMCPTCNVPLNVAESPQANDERNFIRGLIAEGKSKEEIKTALKAEYGEDVLALPEDDGFNIAVYVVPIALGAGLIAILLLLLPKWRRRSPQQAAPVPALSAADAARVDEDLKRYDR